MFSSPTGRFWTIPNVLSLSRIALLPVLWLILSSDNRAHWWWGAGLIVYGIVSDILDGYIARRFNQRSDWGKVLDPLGDKVAGAVVGVFCVLYRGLPLLALGLVLVRDLALLVGGLVVMHRSGNIPTSVNIGRYAALFWGIVLLLYAFDVQPYGRYVLWPVVGFYLVAGVVYFIRDKHPLPSS